MSVFVLLINELKSWLNIRVNDCTIDGDLSINSTGNFRTASIWQVGNGDISLANTGTSTSASSVTISSANGGIYLQPGTGKVVSVDEGIEFVNSTPSYDRSTLNYYEESSFSTAVTGAVTSTATVKVTRVGSLVTISVIPDINSATFSAALWKLESIPSRFLPASGSLYYFSGYALNNNVNTRTSGYIAPGSIQIGKDTGDGYPSNFTAAANSIMGGFTVSFSL